MTCGTASRTRILAFCLASSCLFSTSAFAVTVPTGADPSKVEGRFDEPQAPISDPGTAPSVPELPRAGAKLSGKKFTLNSVAITGGTVYTEAQLRPIFDEYLKKEISLQEAQGIADKITAKYRGDGYILSQAVVPQQNVQNGQLRVQIVEGYIANVVVEGDIREGNWRHLILGYADKIKRQKPLNIKTLERYLLLMDDLPGATAKGTVRPSVDTFGAADLVVNVTHKTLEGTSATMDNRGTRFIGPMQYSATLVGNSVLGLYERTAFRYATTSPMDELQFFNLQHEEQLGYEGTRLVVDLSHSRTRPSWTLTPLDIEGKSDSVTLRLIQPVERSRARNLNARLVFDYRNTDTDTGSLDLTNDRLSVLRAGAEYDFADSWRGVNLFDFQLSRGLDMFNPSDAGVERSVTDADATFTKLNLNVARTQALPWAGFSIYAGASGQYSAESLLASEQFSIGGPGYGGAYDPAELSGDHGAAAKAELRYGRVLGWNYFNSYQAFGYYDIGKVWDKTNTGDNNSLASVGVGLRANFIPWLSGSAEVGLPLTKEVATEADKDPRFFFSLTGRF